MWTKMDDHPSKYVATVNGHTWELYIDQTLWVVSRTDQHQRWIVAPGERTANEVIPMATELVIEL